MSSNKRWPLAIVIAVVAVVTLVGAYLMGQKERASEAEREQPIEAPSRLATQAGEVIVKMTSSEQARNGIAVAALETRTQKRELHGTAVVLAMQELSDLRGASISARAQVEKAKASLAVSH